MLERFRQVVTAVLKPIADLLLRMGVSPNTVTFIGTLGVCGGALGFFPRGELLVGVLVVTAFVFSDLIDGYMARSSGQTSEWGSFLDSTFDRMGDAAVFGGLTLWFAWGGDNKVLACVALWCLVMGGVTSYARAKAESLGMEAKGGIAERSDRLVLILAMTGFSDIFNQEILLAIALWVLAAASAVTVVQRMIMVRRQALAR
ncbi:MAG: CDP-alcohol phosphatidyltransferase family protein [Actinomycetia bacterium]|nr:CDP-alcohol phosphatidyltransferase family protein [Actinomycetes bacterium]